MKNHLVLFLVISVFFISGCSTSSENKKIQELEEKIVTLQKEKQQDFFNKNKECAEYKEKIKDEILSQPSVMSIDNVFYSPKKNSCLYILWKQPFSEKDERYEQQYFLRDLFTNEIVSSFYSEAKGNTKERFDQIVEEYKNQ